jgi:hypothetical protein
MNINRGPEPEPEEVSTAPPELGEEDAGVAGPPSPQPTKVRNSKQKLDTGRTAFLRITGCSPKRLHRFAIDGLLS